METLFEHVIALIPLQALILIIEVAILAYLFWSIRPQLVDLTDQVTKTNGSVIKFQQWKDDHENDHVRMHKENRAILRDIKDDVRSIIHGRE